MNIKKIIKNTQDTVEDLRISPPDNLVSAIIKLLELTHARRLDAEAVAALSDCGITLEVEEG
jgi:hypothetical protein